MIVNTNIASLQDQRQLALSQGQIETAIERLSSGIRINGAKDDAAGLAISNRMTSQINGVQMAQRNANDGISVAQVAEGATNTMMDILQRCRELTVQAANGTYSSENRQAFEQELGQLIEEFGRIANSSEFNGINLLDGTFKDRLFQVGANGGETIPITIPTLEPSELGYYRVASFTSPISNGMFGDNPIRSGDSSSSFFMQNFDAWTVPARTMQIEGQTINISQNESAGSVALKINAVSDLTGVTAKAATNATFYVFPAVGQTVTLQVVAGEDYSKSRSISFSYDGSDDSAKAAMQAINAVAATTGVTAQDFLSEVRTGVSAFFRLVAKNGETLHVLNNSDAGTGIQLIDTDWTDSEGPISNDWRATAGYANSGVMGTDDLFVTGGISLESDRKFSFVPDGTVDMFGDLYGFFKPDASVKIVSLEDTSGMSANAASKSFKVFDIAMNALSQVRADLGAVQSRFDSAISNLSSSSVNISTARSRVMDADYATETSKLSSQQILQKAGSSILSKANMMPQQVLELLKAN